MPYEGVGVRDSRRRRTRHARCDPCWYSTLRRALGRSGLVNFALLRVSNPGGGRREWPRVCVGA